MPSEISGPPNDPPRALARLATAVLWIAALAPVGLLGIAIPRFSGTLTLEQVAFFYAAPAILAVALVAAARAKPATRINMALLLIALSLSAVAAEVLATVVLTSGPEDVRLGQVGPSVGERVQRLRASGVEDVYPRVPGNVLVDYDVGLKTPAGVVHPLASTPGYATVVLCNQLPAAVVYESDRHGFRNPDEIWDEEIQVALVGDSYTQGVCLQDHDQLGALFGRRWTTINLGVSGAGPFHELALLREYAAPRRPPVVVWLYYEGNDPYDIKREARRPWLTAYLDPDHRQELTDVPGLDRAYGDWIDAYIRRRAAERQEAGADDSGISLSMRDVVQLRTLRIISGFGVPFPTRASPVERFPEVLERAVQDVSAWGGQMYFVYVPAFERYRVFVGEGTRGKAEVLEAADSLGVPVIDIDSVFREYPNPEEFWAHPRGHFSPEGNATMAESIIERIERDGGPR